MATIRKGVRKRASSSEGARGRSRTDHHELAVQITELVPDGLSAMYVKSRLHDKSLAIAGLGEPNGWEGQLPEIPHDMATLDHDEMANLLGGFANALSTALWHASKFYIEADAYDEIAEYLEDIAMLDTTESNEAKRKAAARTDERVVTVRGMQKQSYHHYVRFRDLAKTIEHKWRTVSRVGGFLGDEADAEAAGAIKRSTRGQAAGNARGSARGELNRQPRK